MVHILAWHFHFASRFVTGSGRLQLTKLTETIFRRNGHSIEMAVIYLLMKID